MEEKKIKKIDWLYLLIYIIGPLLLMFVIISLTAMKILPDNDFGMVIFAIGIFGPILFWSMGGAFIFKIQKKKMAKELDNSNFHRNNTFSTRGIEVVIDGVNKKVALKFFWNPFETFVFDASKVKNARVDDGRGGVGFMEGSSRVSFLFEVDDIKIRVNTFISNQRFRMDSDYILTGISKADMMVNILNEASKGQEK